MLSVNMNAIGQMRNVEETYGKFQKKQGLPLQKQCKLSPITEFCCFFEGLTDSSVSLVHRPEL